MKIRTALACRSDDIAAELTKPIEIIGYQGISLLDAGAPRADQAAQRQELIEAVRGGKHLELSVTARTFRQKDGMPNRKFLRHNPDKLASLAASYKGMPFLVNHNTYEQSARMGTITFSELSTHGGTGWASFVQSLHVVKPEAVISVLDGTIDRFSIGWHPGNGGVVCSVHKQDVRQRGSCSCWPGDVVEVDGVSQIVEYEFQSAEGTEVSAVNTPAVKGTKIDDVRAALAAELGFEPRKDYPPMQFTRLAAALGFAVLTANEEDRAVQAIESERRQLESERRGRLAAEQERDTLRTQLAASQTRIAELERAGQTSQVNALIEGAIRDGKIRVQRLDDGTVVESKREKRLRALAARDGVEALRDEISELEIVVPVGQRVLTESVRQPERGAGASPELSRELASVAEQLGIDPKELQAEANRLGWEG